MPATLTELDDYNDDAVGYKRSDDNVSYRIADVTWVTHRSGSASHTLEGNKFKLLSRLSLENIDCIKGSQCRSRSLLIHT